MRPTGFSLADILQLRPDPSSGNSLVRHQSRLAGESGKGFLYHFGNAFVKRFCRDIESANTIRQFPSSFSEPQHLKPILVKLDLHLNLVELRASKKTRAPLTFSNSRGSRGARAKSSQVWSWESEDFHRNPCGQILEVYLEFFGTISPELVFQRAPEGEM